MTGTDLVPAPAAEARIAALAARYNRAGGLGLQVLNMLGTRAENLLESLPDPVKDQLEGATERALAIAVDAAQASRSRVPDQPAWLERAVTTAMGAAGGLGGLPSALTELPVTTTLLLRTIQGVARSHGFDPADPEVRAECLTVFAAAGPLEGDDGANMAFFAARVTLTGKGVQTVLARVAPRLATVLGQKLAAQTVPVLGAAAGAATNYAYTSYYQEIAEVHFGLRALARDHGIAEEALRAAFLVQSARLRTRGSVAGG
jgi:hypothetical protein